MTMWANKAEFEILAPIAQRRPHLLLNGAHGACRQDTLFLLQPKRRRFSGLVRGAVTGLGNVHRVAGNPLCPRGVSVNTVPNAHFALSPLTVKEA